MLKRFFCLILVLHLGFTGFSYTDKNAILVVYKDLQPDSFDYNIVPSFLDFIYQAILDGEVKLWDSPLKTVQINADNLINIDQSNNIKFTDASNFFIYEIWNSEKQRTLFTIVGFSFSGENRKGELVNYGFVDYNEISDQLKNNHVKTTANGYYLTTFHQVFMNKGYHFDLVFFNNKTIVRTNSPNPEKDFLNGVKIKEKAFNSSTVNLNYQRINPSKLVSIRISTFDYDVESVKVIDAIEKLFDRKRDYLYYIGGNHISSAFRDCPLLITGISFNLLFTIENNISTYKLVDITPEALGKTFNPMAVALDTLDILTTDSISITQALQKLNFKYEIFALNNNPVDSAFTKEFMTALEQRNYRNLVPRDRKP